MNEVKPQIIKTTEDYVYMAVSADRQTIHRYPTLKKKRELLAATGDQWYRKFLEPDTLARMEVVK